MSFKTGYKIVNRRSLENELHQCFESSMNQLQAFWKEFGIDNSQIADRSSTVLVHIRNLLEDLVKEEEELMINIKNRIKEYEEELRKICSELNEELQESYEDLSLLQKDKVLYTQLEILKQKKLDRIENYKRLQKNENRLCDILGMPLNHKESSIVPNIKELQELEEYVHKLSDEREHRYHKYCQTKQQLTTILEETHIDSETPYIKEVIVQDNELLILSQEKLDQLTEVLEKVQRLKMETIEEIQNLTKRLNNIWDLLAIDDEVKNEFLKNHSESRRSTILAMKQELRRCEDIRRQTLMSSISKLREELVILWDKCYIGENEKHQFEPFYQEDYTEDLLKQHDEEVNRLIKYYKNAENIWNKLNKRHELWGKMIVFEKKAQDPNRFMNRGGSLLQEERERNKLLKDLPKLEEEILQDIEEYQQENTSPILVNGINFVEFMKKEWENHQKEKENERLERQKQRVMSGLPLKCTPCKRTLLSTPASAPSKLLRVNSGLSGTCQLNKQNATPKTPNIQPLKKCKTSVKKTPMNVIKTRAKKSNILTRSNFNKGKNSSLSDSTLYSDFEKELDKTGRERLRSSTIASKYRVLGSKISHTGSFRKKRQYFTNSIGKSKSKDLTKSTQNVSKTPTKVVPARGKLGLPFLI